MEVDVAEARPTGGGDASGEGMPPRAGAQSQPQDEAMPPAAVKPAASDATALTADVGGPSQLQAESDGGGARRLRLRVEFEGGQSGAGMHFWGQYAHTCNEVCVCVRLCMF